MVIKSLKTIVRILRESDVDDLGDNERIVRTGCNSRPVVTWSREAKVASLGLGTVRTLRRDWSGLRSDRGVGCADPLEPNSGQT